MNRRLARRLDRSAVTALVPLLAIVPFWLLAMALVWLPLRALFGVPFWVVPAGWLVLGTGLFLPIGQTLLLAPALGAARPTNIQERRLQPLWDAVARQAGLPPGRFHLRVIDSDELNAFACGGHLVMVTTFALDELHDDELVGVFAHELSHHLGLHTVALTVGHWLSVPIVMLARIGFWLQNVATAATASFARSSPGLTVVGGIVAGLLRTIGWIFLSALYLADTLGNMVGHRAEFDADRRAVRMGYGAELSAALRAIIDLGGSHHRSGLRARLNASHPPARTRAARVDAMLRHPGNPRRRHRAVDARHRRQIR